MWILGCSRYKAKAYSPCAWYTDRAIVALHGDTYVSCDRADKDVKVFDMKQLWPLSKHNLLYRSPEVVRALRPKRGEPPNAGQTASVYKAPLNPITIQVRCA